MTYPVDDCTLDDYNKKQLKSFSIVSCDDTHHQDHLSFIQLKKQGNLIYIYCPYSNITIANKVQECSKSVFTLPFNSNFKINNINYNGSTIKMKMNEIWAPLWTAKTNWYLFQDHDQESLLLAPTHTVDTDLSLDPMEPLGSSSYSLHTFVTVLVIGLFILVLILSIFLTKEIAQQG
ncbi:unnamed protein product [Orchesella dallaii]|uniref:Uncharacterized protein n=1 Tax=Orchesella dallaii TaxID=48710 RepID=A0ABP1PTE0_9HEXA